MSQPSKPHLRHTRNRPLTMEFVDNPSPSFSVSPSSSSSTSNSESSTITANSLERSNTDTSLLELEQLGLSGSSEPTNGEENALPLPAEGGEATPNSAILAQLDTLKTLTDRARACDVDPQLLLLAEIMSKASAPAAVPAPPPQPVHSRYDILAKQVGVMQEGEDIFAVLHRFQYSLKTNNIPQAEHLKALAAILVGQYKEAYFNNVEACQSYSQMRDILLAVGGYTANDCLNSFPLKFRPGGSKSIMQWYNMWSYKFAVMLNHMPFLDNMSEAALENVSKIFAATAVAAGLPNDVRDIVCKSTYPSINTFLQDCTSLCPKPGTLNKHTSSHQFQSNGHKPHFNNHGNQPHRPRFGNDQHHFRPSNTGHGHTGNYGGNNTHGQFRSPLLANPQTPRRDASTITCFKCNMQGHYANNCPNGSQPQHHTGSHSQLQSFSQPQSQSQPLPQPQSQNQSQNTPVQQQSQSARNSQSSARPVRKIDHCSSDSDNTDNGILNMHHSEDDSFVIQGEVNGISTDIIIDSGARVSLISSDFISPDMSPVGSVTLFGISQVKIDAPIYEVEVVLPTMVGKCRLAMDNRLPAHTFLSRNY